LDDQPRDEDLLEAANYYPNPQLASF
jgi:hypothetical protein